ncbi:MAG: EAL domain-containing protein [Actinobacteria bacterium]|nr:EAL domain-containing protein [Actinomycetota bacterium]MBV9252927.1 EAL domain-containing protein [Actinomycetota bacterium]MBV9663712.1 EAL domain-containing protein [Actinomycetota bacterium]MBV9934101.1 EAL domain-containing protein [Actinomycetota bacterium]
MADVRMTATERAWLSWGRSGEPAAGGRRRVRPPIPSRHPAAGWLADELERVLGGTGGFGVVYQPIFDLRTERLVGVEALARLTRVPQLPARCWLAQADSLGLGIHLQLAIVRRVLTDLARIPSSLTVSVNLTADAIADPRLLPVLRTVGVDACRMIVEVVADGHTDWSALAPPLARLRHLGVRTAVNDAVVRELPGLLPDIIKLDPSVVRDVDSEPRCQALAGALMLVAEDLDAVVCAEAIESAAELRYLRRLGVQLGQGFHLGRPARFPWTIGALVGHQPRSHGSLPASPSAHSAGHP